MASSIASMTMPLSISFSRATASAMASSSALLALTAAGAVAMFLNSTFRFDCVGALGAERRGGCDELVGQEQLGRSDLGERDRIAVPVLGEELDVIVFEALERPGILLASLVRLGEGDPGLVPGPVAVILKAGQRPVDSGRTDLEPIAALDRVGEVEDVR